MKILLAFFIIFSFISLFVEVCHARNGPREYWERMTGEPIPEQLKQQFNLEGASSSINQDASQKKTVRFAKDFDVKHVLIIYQTKDKPEDPKPAVEVKDKEIKPNMKAPGQP